MAQYGAQADIRPMTDCERKTLKMYVGIMQSEREQYYNRMEAANRPRNYTCKTCGHSEVGPPDYAIYKRLEECYDALGRQIDAMQVLLEKNFIDTKFDLAKSVVSPRGWVEAVSAWMMAIRAKPRKDHYWDASVYANPLGSPFPHYQQQLQQPSHFHTATNPEAQNAGYGRPGTRLSNVNGNFCPKCMETFLKLAVPQLEPEE